MKRQLIFRPDLNECMVEGRIAPAIADLGIIVQTTSGLVLSTPFPGAINISSLSGGQSPSTSASSVSGGAFPTGLFLTGTHGISTFTPGNFTGNPTLAGPTGTTAGVQTSVAVGSGADDASAPSTPSVTRNTVGSGTPNPVLVFIGPITSGSDSAALPAGQTNRETPPAPPPGLQTPESPTAPTSPTSPLPDPLKPQESLLNGQNRTPSIGAGVTGPATPAGGTTSAPIIPLPGEKLPSSND
jgi:hypothetical protein